MVTRVSDLYQVQKQGPRPRMDAGNDNVRLRRCSFLIMSFQTDLYNTSLKLNTRDAPTKYTLTAFRSAPQSNT